MTMTSNIDLNPMLELYTFILSINLVNAAVRAYLYILTHILNLVNCSKLTWQQLHSRGAHFLEDDPGAFDAPFFSITAKEAAAIDPQQRLVLEASFRAFENGKPHIIIRQATGLY